MNYRKYINYAIFLAIVLVVVGLAVSHSRHMRSLVDAMAGPNREARIKAAEELVAGEQFMDSITGESVGTRIRVVQALEDWAADDSAKIQDPKDAKKTLGASNAVGQLVGFLKDPDRPVRDRISAALLRVGARTDDNLQQVVNGIKDGDANVRKPCMMTLEVLGQPTPQAAAPLIAPETLRYLGQADALSAATALFGPTRNPQVVANLVPKVVAIIKAEAGARGPGGDVLALIPSQQDQATALLLPLLDKAKVTDEGVRTGAADALGKVGSEKAIPALQEAMEKDSPQVRRVAIGAIALIAKPSGEKSLVEALDNPNDDNEARAQAASGLGKIGTTTAVTRLIKALGDDDLKVQVAAVSALARAGDRAVPELLTVLNSGRPLLQIRAAQALGGIHSPQANGPLIALARSGAAPEVRREAIAALGYPGNQAAVQPLVASLGDRDGSVAAAAADALAKVGPTARPALAGASSSQNAAAAYFANQALARLRGSGASVE